jgi:hypothetical protein
MAGLGGYHVYQHFCIDISGTWLSVPFSLMSTFPNPNIQNDQF